MTAKELIETLKDLDEKDLNLPVFYTTYEYNGSTAELRRVEVDRTASLAGPAGIFMS